LDDEEPVAENVLEFATRLSGGVFDNRTGLDGLIGRYAPAWPVNQLSLIDRNILRIALFELLHSPGTPRKTAINEAVELAKVFGSESSARFVNGVLGSVMASLESGEVSPQVTTIGPAPKGR
jgi:N utilization substance protein B